MKKSTITIAMTMSLVGGSVLAGMDVRKEIISYGTKTRGERVTVLRDGREEAQSETFLYSTNTILKTVRLTHSGPRGREQSYSVEIWPGQHHISLSHTADGILKTISFWPSGKGEESKDLFAMFKRDTDGEYVPANDAELKEVNEVAAHIRSQLPPLSNQDERNNPAKTNPNKASEPSVAPAPQVQR